MRTEDHPLAYLYWEGVIPKGNYGAGTMMVFDVGYWEPADDQDPAVSLNKGELKILLWGQKVAGAWTLTRTKDSSSWLFIKKKDRWCQRGWDPEDFNWSAVSGRTFEEIAEGRPAPAPGKRQWSKKAKASPIPLDLEPMLAKIGEPFDSTDWSFELKWDGVRALVFCQEQSTRITSRNGLSLAQSFPELEHVRARLCAHSFIVDGEIVVLDEEGVSHFQELAPRLRADSVATIQKLARSKRAVLYIFDLLYLDGRDLRKLPWNERRRLLKEVLRPDWWVRFSESLPGNGTEIFRLVTDRELEGLVAKKKDAPYLSGRSGLWLKLKKRHLLDCVVVGFTLPKGSRKGIGALLLARYRHGELDYVGKVGSGLTSQESESWRKRLEPHTTETPPTAEPPSKIEASWVKPRWVVEVEYARFTKDRRLFHPVYVRERMDLNPENCSEFRQTPRSVFKRTGEQTLKVSNPNKIFFSQSLHTKNDLVEYYLKMADLILPQLSGRPLSLRRYPDGVEGDDFFQKNPGAGFPSELTTVDPEGNEKIVAETTSALVYLSNLACIELHVTLSRLTTPESPDGILLDLDPQEGCSFHKVKKVALEIRSVLKALGRSGSLKTTGSRGLHIYLPLRAGYSFEQSRLCAGVLAEIVRLRRPEDVTLIRSPAQRPPDAVYIDVPQNRGGATVASAYSVRATPVASVSVPLRWEDLVTDVGPRDFTLKNLDRWASPSQGLWDLSPEPDNRIEDLLPELERLLKTAGSP
jgi:bifunctional non-homologous end joining protein LigD